MAATTAFRSPFSDPIALAKPTLTAATPASAKRPTAGGAGSQRVVALDQLRGLAMVRATATLPLALAAPALAATATPYAHAGCHALRQLQLW